MGTRVAELEGVDGGETSRARHARRGGGGIASLGAAGEGDRMRVLRHPAFVAALVVLLVNDHVLKGAGVVPSWLTGKLSDFAWLVVAPVGASVLFRLRDRRSIAVLLLGFVGLFVTTELSQSAADAVASVATSLGQPTRLWADPTDLIALSILPVTWHLLARPSGPALGWASPRIALGLAVFASVATSQPPPQPPTTWATSAFVVNSTTESVAVRVRVAEVDIDCARIADVDLAVAVGRDLFDTGITFRLAPNDTVPIEPQAAVFAATGGPFGAMPMAANACDIVLLSTDGADDLVVLVSGTRGTVPTNAAGGVGGTVGADHGVVLSGTERDALVFTAGSGLPSAVLDERTAPSDCTLDRPGLAHNITSRVAGSQTLLTNVVGVDGCVTATVRGEDDAESTLFLCVPDGFFPYAPGDVLTFSVGTSARIVGPAGTLSFYEGEITTLAAGLYRIEAAGLERCSGARLACGGYALPERVTVTVDDVPIAPDADGSYRQVRAGHTSRLVLGTVESTILGAPDCDPSHTTAGTRMQAVLFSD